LLLLLLLVLLLLLLGRILFDSIGYFVGRGLAMSDGARFAIPSVVFVVLL